MIAIIGGSGFYQFLDDYLEKSISTPFGGVTFQIGTKEEREVCFIPRHGHSHNIIPSKINYKANIYGAFKLGADFILATNAVGSLDMNINPGTIAVPKQIIDFTHGRPSTFFDGSDFGITTRSGRELKGVVHTDVTQPFDQGIRQKIMGTGNTLNLNIYNGGTIVVVNGPRYETPAEINAYRIMGADFAGMTSSPEAFLAKELEIPYASTFLVTNYASGMQKSVTHSEVDRVFKQNVSTIKSLYSTIIKTYG